MADEKVDVRVCRVLHTQLDARCEERHRVLDERLERIACAVESFGGELRTLILDAAKDRAWVIVGKYGAALVALAGTVFGAVALFKGG